MENSIYTDTIYCTLSAAPESWGYPCSGEQARELAQLQSDELKRMYPEKQFNFYFNAIDPLCHVRAEVRDDDGDLILESCEELATIVWGSLQDAADIALTIQTGAV